MSATGKKLLAGAEDLLGVLAFGLSLVAVVTTSAPSPEAGNGPASWFGYMVAALFASSAVLFFLAARHLHKTGTLVPLRHIAPVLCALAVPTLGLLHAHL